MRKKFFIIFLPLIAFGVFFSLQKVSAATTDLPDLDVLYISRTPRYERYNVTTDTLGRQLLKVGTEFFKRWPDKDELVTFTGRIANEGQAISGEFQYRWSVDGEPVLSGVISNLNPGSSTEVQFLWRWQDGDHLIKLEVDPDRTINEITIKNNEREDRTNALGFVFYLDENFCQAFEQVKTAADSYSCYDWLQQQVSAFNQLLAGSMYGSAPQGALTRIRIDAVDFDSGYSLGRISVFGNHCIYDDWEFDGHWGFPWSTREDCGETGADCYDAAYVAQYATAIDWHLLREWGKQLGLLDESSLDISQSQVKITDNQGSLVTRTGAILPLENKIVHYGLCSPMQPFGVDYTYNAVCQDRGLMADLTRHYLSEYSVLSLNRYADYYKDSNNNLRHLPKRAGYQAEFLRDIPLTNTLQVLDKNGHPLSHVGIMVYQGFWGQIPDLVKYSGSTDSNGRWAFPDKTALSYGERVVTANPFATAHSPLPVAGATTNLIIKLTVGNQTEYHFLDITDFNLAFWYGNFQKATYTLQTKFTPQVQQNYLIIGPQSGGGPQVRMVDPFGRLLTQFFVYETNFRGGVRVASGDVNGDGQPEIVVAPGAGRSGEVRIFNARGNYLASFLPYGETFRGGINLAVGDLDGDGVDEIVTVPQSGGGPNVRIFGYRNGQYLPTTENFMAYDKNFRGGVNLAVGDLDGDGKGEILTAPLSGGGPQVRIFGYRDKVFRPVILGLMVYPANFRGGVTLTAGDINGDGRDELITGVAGNGSPHIQIFGYDRKQMFHLAPGFMAFGQNFSGGVNVATLDTDQDGKAEIIAGMRSNGLADIKVWSGEVAPGRERKLRNDFLAFSESFWGGVTIAPLVMP